MRQSSSVLPTPVAQSPFDAIRRIADGGTEFWSARDLMPLLGYDSWRRFADSINRAMDAARNTGCAVNSLFAGAVKKSEGRPAEDYHLSRFACYLVAINGDPRKPEVAAAQAYFAIRTREAEVGSTVAVPQTYAAALREAANQAERAEAAEARVAALEPSADAWRELADAEGDYSVGDAAKVLSRDPHISIGQNRLFALMAEQRWIYRGQDGCWRPYHLSPTFSANRPLST